MDLTFHEALKSFKSDGHKEKVEPGDLLEESWFFGSRKARIMSRSFSDPCTSSSAHSRQVLPAAAAAAAAAAADKSYEETYESIKKLKMKDESAGPCNLIMRAPSMPPRVERKDQNSTTKGGINDPRKRSKSSRKMLSSNLIRAPSLPTNLGDQQEIDQDDEEVEFSMGKLIRQASLNSSNVLPPKTHAAKGAAPSASLSRSRSTMKVDQESIKPEEKSTRQQRVMSQLKPQRSLSYLEFKELKQLKPQKSLSYLELKELQGLKDLGFNPDTSDLSPNASKLVPGMPEMHTIEEDEENSSGRPPAVGGKKSAEDLKAQIKFWARAVASNVRQEC